MKRLWARQSDLSLATGVFYLASAVFSVLTFTLFRIDSPPRNPALILSGGVALCAALAVFVRGRRLGLPAAAVLVTTSAATLLYLVGTAATEVRALTMGVLFLTLFVYLIWFMPRWLSRVLGYSWLGLYVVIVTMRFSGDIDLALTTVVATTVVVGELIGRFKHGLEAASLTDPLSGVWNRRGLFLMLDRAIAGAGRTGRPLSILFIDLDGFKEVNDRLGHAAGDEVLQRFTARIDTITRPQGTLARLGGDEFVLLLPDTEFAEARRLGERLREVVAETHWSFGAAQLLPGEQAHALIARADELMLAQKRARGLERS